MDIKQLEAFKAVAKSKGWNLDGETTPTGYIFYSAQTQLRWEGWQEAQAVPEPVLDAPASVGAGTFQKGVKWSTVIGAAQRNFQNTKNNKTSDIINMIAKIATGDFVLVPREMPESFDEGLYVYSNSISIVDECSEGFIPMPDINHAEVWKLVVEAQEQGHE